MEKDKSNITPGAESVEKKEPAFAVFNVTVKALIHREDGKLLLLRATRFRDVDKWELPGGVIDDDEIGQPLESVLAREIHEECGSELQVTIGPLVGTLQREAQGDNAALLTLALSCVYEGGQPVLSDEHSDFAWVGNDDISRYAIAGGYEKIISEYLQKLQNQE